jgi:adenylate cyclase
MSQAITAHEGRIDAFYGDGFMAVFGLEGTPARAAQAAISASADIVRAVEALNREFGAALPLPLRIGIGIHAGQAITGAVENESLGRREITVGETVMVASQLESATRRVLADVVVSEDTIRVSGRSYGGTTTLKIPIKGREKPLTAYGFASAPELARPESEARQDASVSPGGTKAPEPAVAGVAEESEDAAQQQAAAADTAQMGDGPAEALATAKETAPPKKRAASKPRARRAAKKPEA